ncbi:lasso peptide biosynthesis B2 protein [Sphingomonas sp.]|uniref:lasso peptide biosynthesis B2 protein n=1 Tax=Sphingomonas sp. TaxID=28214 RepID=UPI001B208C9A|nr:lasso peptide biosynthesis B2 protein [Sphingomonas sp.]MBO9712500.1 lasso peptide biosynthesis B2 protein [Sphingomonas sp.]
MTHQLREGLSYCFVGDRAVFLDLPGDRYFCLGADLEDRFRTWAVGDAGGDVDALTRHGLLVSGSTPPACARAAAPTASLLEIEHDRPRASLLPVALLQFAVTSASLRLAGLAATVARFRRRKERVRASAAYEGLAGAIAHAHEATALLTASHDKCLARSIAVASHMAGRGLTPILVLGVRLRPFHAHCWVQLDGRIANDRIENVRTFTPILAI